MNVEVFLALRICSPIHWTILIKPEVSGMEQHVSITRYPDLFRAKEHGKPFRTQPR